MNNVRCHLKGCDAAFIQSQVHIYMRSGDVSATVNMKVIEIINNYSIYDCSRLILKHGDMHDAFVKYAQRCNNHVITSDKLQFHRELAFGYIKDIINAKITYKVSILSARISHVIDPIDRICAICIDDVSIADSELYVTRCNHIYHRHCIQQWLNSKTSCPTCRRIIQ